MSTLGFYTDSQVVAAFPSAADLTPAQQQQAAIDATAVYAYANQNAGIDETDLRRWGENQGIYPAQMNIALALLQDAGKLFTLPQPGPLTPDAITASAAPVQFPAEHLTVPELQRVAKRAGVEVAKSASKQELIDAIRATAAP